MNYIGLDFESSGTDPWGKHVPIQLGMAIQLPRRTMTEAPEFAPFVSLIGGWDWAEFEWSEEAAKVHSISREVLVKADPVWVVDIKAAAWLIEQIGYAGRMYNITVGWNVAGYDRQFVTRWMPNLNRLLSYRTLDLNALVLAEVGDEKGYKDVKQSAKNYSNGLLGITEASRHDALIDATAALLELEYLRS